MIESLESRRLLSASLLRNGLLNITGTSGSDTVVLTVEDVKEFQTSGGGFLLIPYVVVTTNGTEDGRFSTLKIRRIFADLGDGNDSYTVPYSLQFQQYVLGGNGNDTLVGGRNRDALDGGPGDDSMTGGRGDDILGSAAGGDTMVGGLGFDTVDMHRRTAAVNLTMDGVANDGASGETGDLANDIETILGGSGADLIDCGGFATTTDLLTGFVQGVTINGNNGHNTTMKPSACQG